MSDIADEFRALTEKAGLLSASRTRVELRGSDAASFFNNLCTNDVRRLTAGQGCETFLTTVQGKIMAHGYAFRVDDAVIFDTVDRQGERVAAHLDRYLIREKVDIQDSSAERGSFWVAGEKAPQVLEGLGVGEIPRDSLEHAEATIDGKAVWVARVDRLGDASFLMCCNDNARDEIATALMSGGATNCSEAAGEALRIESGFPEFGVDIDGSHLPQEVGRDSTAISFTKGCYLGQETVARIDALGHVNWKLVRLVFEPNTGVPNAGEEVQQNGQAVGAISSSAYSPKRKQSIAFARIRASAVAAGAAFETVGGRAALLASRG